MEKKTGVTLFLIVLLGLFLRIVDVPNTPPGLNWDEVSHGYNAYSVLRTGTDQWGQKFPLLNFRAYGDYPTTLNLYLTIPFIAIFGLTEFALRIPHVILGTLTIISVYFLALGMTKKKDLSLFCAFLASVIPWYIFTSRFVLQSNLSVFLLVTAAALFINREFNKKFIFVSAALLALTLFSYHTTRIFSPLFLIGLLIIYKDQIKNKTVYIFTILFLILSVFILINPFSRSRGNVLFLIDQSAINKIEEARNNSNFPSGPTKLLYNRATYFVKKFSQNYTSYFSPKFLFFNGGTQYQFSIPKTGLVYPILLPFFYIGLVLLIKRSWSDRNYQMLLLWLIISPIPASLTNETYAVIRATTMLPIPEILSSIGFFYLLDKLNEKYKLFTTIIYIIIVLLSLENYLTIYFTEYRKDYSWSWQYGYKEVVNYADTNYDKYDNIIVTKKYGEPHEYFLFYLSYDPLKYLNDEGKITFNQSNWWWVDRFDKFYFLNDWQVKDLILESEGKVDCESSKCLLITSPGNYPSGFNKLDTIKFLDGKPAFEIYEN